MRLSILQPVMLLPVLVLCSMLSQAANKEDISISKSESTDYYHLRLQLQASDFELTDPNSERTPKYSEDKSNILNEGGRFEIFVKKEAIPENIESSVVKHYLTLGMPRTRPDIPGASMYIREKERLFNELKDLKAAPLESLSVIVELNPYVEVMTGQPLKLRLTEPKLFFRQAYGRYINYIGPLEPEDQKPAQ